MQFYAMNFLISVWTQVQFLALEHLKWVQAMKWHHRLEAGSADLEVLIDQVCHSTRLWWQGESDTTQIEMISMIISESTKTQTISDAFQVFKMKIVSLKDG